MGEPSSLTGDVGPAFPVVIPVGRAGTAVDEAATISSANAAGSQEGAEAEAAMWKALGDVVTTRLRLAADRISQGAPQPSAPPFTSTSRLPPIGPGLGMGALPSVPVSGAGPGPWGTIPPMPPVVAPACSNGLLFVVIPRRCHQHKALRCFL
ncbi:unnamed protein product [Cladocopium goreaui]|uniref:Uncharacterized protein n=1 Tax=Cladocopium goreaui TaxID=2562237 RepID=A0A9P1D8I9_9DINO|nr:unnamed protein product [Cladocopium goreaui]